MGTLVNNDSTSKETMVSSAWMERLRISWKKLAESLPEDEMGWYTCCSVSLIRVTYCLKGGEPYEEENDVGVLRQKLIEGYRLEKPAHCSEEA